MNLPRFSVRNPVAVNLLMWAIIVAGLYLWFQLPREFFPNLEPEQVFITVAYPGTTPDEIEKAVTRRIEREIDDVNEIEEIEAKVLEGATVVVVTLEDNANRDRVLNDLRTEVDKIERELPEEAEDPEIVEVRPFIPVISIVVYGDVAEERLQEIAREVREDLLDYSEISQVVVSGTRKREIWIEVYPERLEEYGLTFEDVGQIVAGTNLDVPGGQLRSPLGNIRVRTLGESERALPLESLVLRSSPDGIVVRLADVASVRETFEDKVERGGFAGKRACTVTVFKAPEEDALKIAAEVSDYVERRPERLGGAVNLSVTTDLARFIAQRLDLMMRNARTGIILVVLALAFFLNARVAFWVAMGLPISFLGTFVLMDWMGVSINLISLFGLIVVLGLVVDDAIVVGENIYTKIRQGLPMHQAAIEGAQQVSIPVVAAVLTTIVAFLPLGFISGQLGNFLVVLPKVIVAALTVSLIEVFVILPAHLAHQRTFAGPPLFVRLSVFTERWSAAKNRFLEETLPEKFASWLTFFLHWRYVTVAVLLSFSLAVSGLVVSNTVPFVLIQDEDAETVLVNVEMTAGTPVEQTERLVKDLERAALGVEEVKSVFSVVGTSFSERGRETAADPATVGQLNIELFSAEEREAKGLRSSEEVINAMRQNAANVLGVRKITFLAQSGGPQGPDIEIRLRSDDLDTLFAAVEYVRQELQSFEGVLEIEDDLQVGKQEVRLRMRESARSLGLTTSSLAVQIRHALFGFEVQEIQREDEEVKVRVLLPQAARRQLSDLYRLRIATPDGGRVPLEEIAQVYTNRGQASLARVDGKRTVTVKAEVDQTRANVSQITTELSAKFESIDTQFPFTSIAFEGRRKQTRESLSSLAVGFPAALLIIYVIIAILFRSYFQPIIVMVTIPFSLVGAIIGHFFLGYPFTFLSMIGCVALAGIVVNDSLILVDFVNKLRDRGTETFAAVVAGARARLRAILLTSITTILGLIPLMMERSFQARFLIPMALSIVFGLAFATVLTLVLIPTLYLVYEDMRLAWKRFSGKIFVAGTSSPPVETEGVFDEAAGLH